MKSVSIVVPVYNEGDNIEHFAAAVAEEMAKLDYEWELIFVDDGSRDNSLEIIERLHTENKHIKVLALSRNCGHQMALTCGLDHAQGEAVISMDGDMQHPPALIPELLRNWEAGYEIVQTIRQDTQGVNWLKKKTSELYYRLINNLSSVHIRPGGSDFRLLDRQAVLALRKYREHDRFLRGMVTLLGFKMAEVPFVAPPRFAGKSKYSFSKMAKLAVDGIVGYSPIAMAKNAIGMAIACEEYGAKFFANGATPGGILEHPGVVKDPERVRESWNSAFGGSSNANKVAVLEEGMKYTPISISPEQAQFLETRKFQINEIARIFRIPPHMIGDLEKSSFSNIEQQSLEFVKYTLDPWVCRWEQSMQRALLSPDEKKNYFFKFNVDGLLRGDYQSRMNGYAVGRQNGWMSANDIRELENLDRIPEEEGGDLYLINGNMTKLKDAGIFAASAQTQEEADETKETQTEPEPEDGRTRFRKKEAL